MQGAASIGPALWILVRRPAAPTYHLVGPAADRGRGAGRAPPLSADALGLSAGLSAPQGPCGVVWLCPVW